MRLHTTTPSMPIAASYWCARSVRRKFGVVKAQERNVAKPFFVLGTQFSTFQAVTHHTAACNFLRGTDPLPSQRKTCALPFVSPSTAESGLKRALAVRHAFSHPMPHTLAKTSCQRAHRHAP